MHHLTTDMETLHMTPATNKMDGVYFRLFPLLLMAMFIAVVTVRLSLMQLDGLLTFGASFVTALFAMTALLYARARAVIDPTEMASRALIADESLKAAFMAVMGYGVTGFVFLSLSERYKPFVGPLPRFEDFQPDNAPAIWAFLCTVVFALPVMVKINLVVGMTAKNMGLPVKYP